MSAVIEAAVALDAEKRLATFTGKGLTSKRDITVELFSAPAGSGIVFFLLGEGAPVVVPATADMVVNTMRNVVLGVDRVRLCIVEHFLCAAAIWGISDLYVSVDGPEMPLGDGSAQFWVELFESAGISKKAVVADIELSQAITVERGDRSLLAVPADKFSVTYLMDWKHPRIGQKWQTWNPEIDAREIFEARTFGMLKDHQLLGLDQDVVSMTEDGFTMELRFEDEPVRHKLLDLIGDLALVGINPLRLKARFISIKAGHEMDVDMARKLRQALGR